MPLTLITGPANAAKAGEVFARFRASPGGLLVVPTAADEAHYRRELAADGALVGGTVTRFAGLMREAARRVVAAGGDDGAAPATPLGPQARRRVVAAAVRRARLDRLAASAASPGFAAAAEELFDELERALVAPAALAAALRGWAGGDAARGRHAAEVSALYARYRELLDELGRPDAALAQWRALDALRAHPQAWGATAVAVYGFDDLSRAQLETLRALAGPCGAPVTVSLTWEPGRRAFGAHDEVHAELAALAADAVALPASDAHYAAPSRGPLHHLERTLFEPAPPGPPPAPGDAVALLEAGGERAEAELVAAEALRLLEAGLAPEEICVVVRDPSAGGGLLGRVLDEYGVPHAVEWEVPFSHTAVGRGLLALLRCALGGGRAEDLVAYLRTPGVLRVADLADRLEAEVRRVARLDAAAARGRFEREGTFVLDEIDRVAAAARTGGSAPAEQLAFELRRLAARPWHRRAAVPAGEARADLRASAAALRALGDVIALGPALAPPAEELERVLGEVAVGLGDPPRPGAITVSHPLGVRARRFRAVIAAGLQEGEFPRRGRPDPFLSDDARAALRARGVGLPERETAEARERSLFYATCSRPTELLRLAYRVADDEGNPALPSAFLADVRAAFGDALDHPAHRRPLADVTWPPAVAPTARERARAEAARGARRPPAALPPLRSPAVLERLAGETLSAGSLERYAGCAVAWLVERRLDPRRLAPEDFPLRRGSVLHEVLERVLEALREESGSARVTPERLARAHELLEQTVDAVLAERTLHPHQPSAAAEAERLRRALRRYLDHEARCGSAWEPVAFELGFGMGEEDEPALELGGGEVRLRGRIDRVEIDPTGDWAAVRDYKTSGSPKHQAAHWTDEDQLQAALYLRLVERAMDKRPAAALYQPLTGRLRPRGAFSGEAAPQDGLFENDGQDPEAFEAMLDWAQDRALTLAREMRSGALPARPQRCGFGGRGCRFPGICRTGA